MTLPFFVGEDRDNWLYFGGFVGVLYLLIRPIWVGPIAPMTDFGGHAAIAEIWAQLNEVELYQNLFERRSGVLQPNTLVARSTGLLDPLVSTLTAVRLFTTLAIAGTAMALQVFLRAFGRSRWLIFLMLPLLWNGSFYWGMLNYIAVFPLFFVALALAKRSAESEQLASTFVLASTGAASFFVHGLGGPITIAVSTLVFLICLRSWRFLGRLSAFLPGSALWFGWWYSSSGQGLPDGGILDAFEQATWFNPSRNLWEFGHMAMDATLWPWDSVSFGIIVVLWLVLIGYQAMYGAEGEKTDNWYEGYSLLILVASLGISSWALPTYIKQTIINVRIMPLFAWCALALPRIRWENRFTKSVIGLAICNAVVFGGLLNRAAEAFAEQETRPLAKLVDKIPQHKRVECLNVKPEPAPVFYQEPLDLNCPALVTLRRSGYGGFGFPETGFNAVKFRHGKGYRSVRNGGHEHIAKLQHWDYLIARGTAPAFEHGLVERVAEVGGNGTATRWILLRVKDMSSPEDASDLAGGDGGLPFNWECPGDQMLVGLDGSLFDDETIGGIRPICQSRPLAGRKTSDPTTEVGPRIGDLVHGRQFSLRCPSGEAVSGLRVLAGLYIDRLKLKCSGAREASGEYHIEEGQTAGGSGGSPFEISCDAVATGITGRAGVRLDAIGLLCTK
jgi:hypothetical protein